jgi:YVTN family beta-propeller protein
VVRPRWARVVVVLGLAGALVGVVPDGMSAVAARARCRATAFVVNGASGTVSTIDVKTRTKNPTDIAVGTGPFEVAVTPDGKTAFVTNAGDTVSTIDVKTRTTKFPDMMVASNAVEPPRPGNAPRVAVTPDGKTAFVTNDVSDSVSVIDVKTRTKNPADIPVGAFPVGVAVTPCRR